MTLQTLPDELAAVLTFLAADVDVTAARTTAVGPPPVKGSVDFRVRSGTRWPMLKVYRVGGSAADAYLDRPLLQVEAIGAPNDLSSATDDVVRALLRTAQAALHERLRWSTVAGVRFSSIETVTHMQDGYDDLTKQLRWFSRFDISSYPIPDED